MEVSPDRPRWDQRRTGCRWEDPLADVSESVRKPNHLTLTGQLYHVGVNCLIDTGAICSVVSSFTYTRIPAKQRPPLAEETRGYRGANGQRLKIWGKMAAPLTFGRVKVQQTLLVADIDGDVLLGMDFLREQSCFLNLKNGVVRVQEEESRCWDLAAIYAHNCTAAMGKAELKLPMDQTDVAEWPHVGTGTQQEVTEPTVQLSVEPDVMGNGTLVSAWLEKAIAIIQLDLAETVPQGPEEMPGGIGSRQTCEGPTTPLSCPVPMPVHTTQVLPPDDRKDEVLASEPNQNRDSWLLASEDGLIMAAWPQGREKPE